MPTEFLQVDYINKISDDFKFFTGGHSPYADGNKVGGTSIAQPTPSVKNILCVILSEHPQDTQSKELA